MLNLSFKVRLTCCLTSHLSACSKLLDLKATRSMRQFYYLKMQFQVAKQGVGSRQSEGARYESKVPSWQSKRVKSIGSIEPRISRITRMRERAVVSSKLPVGSIKSKGAWPLASLSVARGLFWLEGVLEF